MDGSTRSDGHKWGNPGWPSFRLCLVVREVKTREAHPHGGISGAHGIPYSNGEDSSIFLCLFGNRGGNVMDTWESGNLEGKRLQCYSPHFISNQLVPGIVFVWAKLRATISISICCIIVQ
jgi:hypothetical protein